MADFRIMIIDDDPTRKEKYEAVLKANYELIFITKASDIIQIDSERVHAYLVDVILDDWDNELPQDATEKSLSYILGKIKQQCSECPVFLISNLHQQNSGQYDQSISELFRPAFKYHINHFFAWSEFSESKQSVIGTIDLQLRKHFSRSALFVKPDDPVIILHLSDLQFGDPETSDSAFLSEKTIAKELRKQELIPDIVVFSGDISYRSHSEEYERAHNWILDLFKAFSPNGTFQGDRALLVPGNHDVNIQLGLSGLLGYNFKTDKPNMKGKDFKDYSEYGFVPFMKFAARLTENQRWSYFDNKLNLVLDNFLHLGLRFYLLNSCSEFEQSEINRAGVDESSMTNLSTHTVIKEPEHVFSIAVSHHGPSWQYQPRKEKSIENWPKVAKFLENVDCGLYLHGHVHACDARLYGAGNSIKNMLLVKAGTPHLKPGSREEDEPRGFNIIKLIRNNGLVIAIQYYKVNMIKSTITIETAVEYKTN